MGCVGSSIETTKLNNKRQTVFGVLEVKVQQAVIQHETSTLFSMDPYVNVKFSNQKQTGAIIKKGGKNPKFNDVFKFIVNSCYKYYGRCLEVELMDSNTGSSDSLIGYGIIDLDPYLNALQVRSPEQSPGQFIQKEPQTVSLRCFINYDRRQAGFIMLTATFREEKTDVINFRFETAEFKRSTRTFGDMNCSVKVTIGEEIIETKKSLDTKLRQPVWKDEHISFVCPASVENVLIEVMDQNDLIGSLTIPKANFLVDRIQQQSFSKEILHKQEIAGVLKFNTLLNFDPIFKDLQGQYTKKTPEQKIEQQKHSAGNKHGQQQKPGVNKPQEKKENQIKPIQVKPEQKKQVQPSIEIKPQNTQALK